MHNNNLTIDQAAEVLGISRRMLIYYRNGEKTHAEYDRGDWKRRK